MSPVKKQSLSKWILAIEDPYIRIAYRGAFFGATWLLFMIASVELITRAAKSPSALPLGTPPPPPWTPTVILVLVLGGLAAFEAFRRNGRPAWIWGMTALGVAVGAEGGLLAFDALGAAAGAVVGGALQTLLARGIWQVTDRGEVRSLRYFFGCILFAARACCIAVPAVGLVGGLALAPDVVGELLPGDAGAATRTAAFALLSAALIFWKPPGPWIWLHRGWVALGALGTTAWLVAPTYFNPREMGIPDAFLGVALVALVAISLVLWHRTFKALYVPPLPRRRR